MCAFHGFQIGNSIRYYYVSGYLLPKIRIEKIQNSLKNDRSSQPPTYGLGSCMSSNNSLDDILEEGTYCKVIRPPLSRLTPIPSYLPHTRSQSGYGPILVLHRSCVNDKPLAPMLLCGTTGSEYLKRGT